MKLNTIAFFVIFIISGLFAQQISLVEYFFDQDPGYGSGKQIVFTQGQNVDINASLDLSSLQKGYHTLFVRTQDTYGRWSIPFVKQFYIIGITNQPQISKLEYFFDQDPGYGKGNNLQITPSQDISNNFMIDLSNLSEGQHNLYVRSKDNNGNWSISYSKLFFVTKNANNPQNKITSINYYFVKDSTKSNTFSYSNFAASADADISFNLDFSQLQENATYQVKLSAVDQSGNVSIPYFTYVTVTPSTTNLTLLSPNGGENWQVGSNHDIQWTSSNIDSIKIEFSSNNGNDWNLITTDIQASQNKYSWIVPDVISQSSKVKIISLSDTTYSDQSDSTFSIISDTSSPGWTYTITGNNHIILIPTSANPNISDTTLSSGDYIGVFYDSSGVLACAGYSIWDGTKNITVTAWGDDNSTSNIKEGFETGEKFKWKIWQKKSGHTYTAYATYSTGGQVTNDSTFATNGISSLSSLKAFSTLTAINDIDLIPKIYSLFQNYPNPFNPSTTISYQLSALSKVVLKIYDVLGREIRTLVNKEQPAGRYSTNFNASDLTSGIYFYRLQAGKFIQTKKMVLLR